MTGRDDARARRWRIVSRAELAGSGLCFGLVAVPLLGERPNGAGLAGVAVSVAGVAWGTAKGRRPAPPPASPAPGPGA